MASKSTPLKRKIDSKSDTPSKKRKFCSSGMKGAIIIVKIVMIFYCKIEKLHFTAVENFSDCKLCYFFSKTSFLVTKKSQ